MAEAIGALRAELSANIAQFQADMAKARSIVQTAAARMQRSFANVRSAANGLSKDIFSLRTALTGGAAASAVYFVKRMTDAAGAIEDTAIAIGITSEELQELQFAAKITGVEQEALTAAMTIFTRGLGQAKQGIGTARQGLAELGIEMAAIKGKAPIDVLNMVADRLTKIEDPLRRNAVLAQLFGRNGVVMAQMLMNGSRAIDELRERAHRLGLVVSNEMIKKAADAGDEFDVLAGVFRVAGINLAAQFLPAMKDVAEIMTSPGFQDGVKSFAENIGSAVRFIRDNIDVIERMATAYVGMRGGAVLGSAFGKTGARAGGILGAGMGFLAKDIQAAFGGGGIPGDTAPRTTGDLLSALGMGAGTAPPAAGGTDWDGTGFDVNEADKKRKAVEDLTNDLLREWQQLGLTNQEREVYNNLARAGVTADSEAGQGIAALTRNIYQQEQAMKRLETVANSVADALYDAFQGIVIEGKSAIEVLRDMIVQLGLAIIKALILKAVKTALGIPFAEGGSVGSPMDIRPGIARAGGGSIRGPGTATSDSIPAWLSDGEYVVNARAARRHRRLLDAINFGGEGFAEGGMAGAGGGMPAGGGFVFAPVIQALDAEGVDRVLKRHGARFAKAISGAQRKNPSLRPGF